MNCPECNARLRTVDSRPAPNNTTRRRLACPDCGARFFSLETIISDNNNKAINKANKVNISEIFSKLAKNCIVYGGYTSSLTGGTYQSREDAFNDTVAELERIYNER